MMMIGRLIVTHWYLLEGRESEDGDRVLGQHQPSSIIKHRLTRDTRGIRRVLRETLLNFLFSQRSFVKILKE